MSLSTSFSRHLILAISLAVAEPRASVLAQQVGEKVYERASPSVFLLETVDSDGRITGTATGFLVAPDLILTNAHVASAGSIDVVVGTVRIRCATERTDVLNDLATCRLSARGSAAPLVLAKTAPKAGVMVFALGNPRGLERSISQGLFTGEREIQGRRVFQISAPISPGSSGGPILDADGDLIGVAVGSLQVGQNLNFAVPVDVVRSFLSGRVDVNDSSVAIATANKLIKQLVAETTYSDDPDSPWAKLTTQVEDQLTQTINATDSLQVLQEVYTASGFWFSRIQILAARKALQVSKTPSKVWLMNLARALYDSSIGTGAEVDEAERVAIKALSIGQPAAEDVLLLAGIQLQAEKWQASYDSYLKASSTAGRSGVLAARAFYGLFQTSRELNRNPEAESWFKKIPSEELGSFQVAAFAEFLSSLSRNAEAGDAYMKAYNQTPTLFRYLCSAAYEYYLADKYDEGLASARRCIEVASPKKGAEAQVGLSHKLISTMLRERGVYDEAAAHAREAIAIDGSDAFAYRNLAEVLQSQRRFSEAVGAIQTAIRLSDGKYAGMHFTLGSNLFQLKRWPEAAQAYETAANLDASDASAAYNVAASNYNNGSYAVALRWYREVLRRRPNHPERESIQRTIQQLELK